MLTALVVGRLTSGLEASREAYRRLSSEDGLTGVGNYRSLIERLRHETARHQRRNREFAVLTLDLDNFKAVNETQGHLVGDLLLAIVGSMIDLKVRTEDAVFRQGGDEFSVIAPETGRDQAEELARRIEDAVSRDQLGRRPDLGQRRRARSSPTTAPSRASCSTPPTPRCWRASASAGRRACHRSASERERRRPPPTIAIAVDHATACAASRRSRP